MNARATTHANPDARGDDAGAGPSISLCVIARDEERSLPRLLRSVKGAVDEIIVVDTGSTDSTADVARAFGARVLHHPFADDFSAPRNVGLDAATGSWILVLDADEALAPGAAASIRRAVCDARLAGCYLKFENDLGGGRAHVCALLRLFRNDPAIRFEFVIHEQVAPAVIRHARSHGLRLATLDDAVVLHDGYRPEVRDARGKDARNERLLRRQVGLTPDHPYAWYKFGDFLRRFPERRAEARAALDRAANLLRATDDAEARAFSFGAEVYALLALETERSGDAAAALAVAEEGRARFPDTPNLLYVIAHLLLRLGRAREAFRAYARLRGYDGRLLAVPPEPGATGALAFFGMGRALHRMGRLTAARRCLEHAARLDPARMKIHAALAEVLLASHAPHDAVAALETALAHEPASAPLHVRLGGAQLEAGRPRDAERTFLAALRHGAPADEVIPRVADARLDQGDLEGAFLAYQERPDAPACRAGIALLAGLAGGKGIRDAAGRDPHALRIAQRLARALART